MFRIKFRWRVNTKIGKRLGKSFRNGFFFTIMGLITPRLLESNKTFRNLVTEIILSRIFRHNSTVNSDKIVGMINDIKLYLEMGESKLDRQDFVGFDDWFLERWWWCQLWTWQWLDSEWPGEEGNVRLNRDVPPRVANFLPLKFAYSCFRLSRLMDENIKQRSVSLLESQWSDWFKLLRSKFWLVRTRKRTSLWHMNKIKTL